VMFVAGNYSVTVLAIDSGGTRTIGPVTLSVVARPVEQPPLLFTPEIVVAEATGPTGATVSFDVSVISFVDPTPVAICDHASGDLFPFGTTTVQCSYTDSLGSASATFLVRVSDTVPPVLHVPANIVSGTPVVSYVVTATDTVDTSPDVTCTPASGSTFVVGTTTVVCRAVDNSANVAQATFKVTITGGASAPVITVPDDILAEASSPAGAVVSFVATATDSATIICTPPSGSTFAVGLTVVTCSATSAGGSSADSFNVTVVDTLPPILTLPASVNASATGPGGGPVTFTTSASDLVDGTVAATCDHSSGDTFPIGTTTVDCNAIDAHFNFAFGSFVVTVSSDTTPPVLTLPGTITKEATSAAGATVSYVASAFDAVDGPVPVSCDHASGSTFPIGTTTVQCTATDAHHNTALGSFLVIVRDSTPPALSLPANITKEATGPSGAVVTYSATATDIVDGSRPVTCDHASGSTFPLGTTTVQCTATDTHNNTAHGSFTVLVRDTTPPQIVTITANPNSIWPPNHKMVDVTISVIASDLVDPHPVSHIIAVSSNQSINGNGDGNTSPDWVITGPLTLQVRSERAGGSDRVYTITIETTDSSGNHSNGTTTVTVSNSRGRAVH
jgi:hypothetical protein